MLELGLGHMSRPGGPQCGVKPEHPSPLALEADTDPHYAPGAPPCSLPVSPWEMLIPVSVWVKIILVSNTICLETTKPMGLVLG